MMPAFTRGTRQPILAFEVGWKGVPQILMSTLWQFMNRRVVVGVVAVLALAGAGLVASHNTPAPTQRERSLAVSQPWRQYHVVTLIENGVAVGVVTKAHTVVGVLRSAGVQISPNDYISPSVASNVMSGETIQVATITKHITTLNVALPYSVQTKTNPNLAPGISEVVQPGRQGLAVETESVVEAGSRVLATTIVSKTVVKHPVTEVLSVAAPSGTTVSFGGPYVKKIYVEETAYWANPAWSTGYTYTGVKAAIGSIAVDPTVIPLGTRLYVPGYGYGVADDTGGAIKDYHIDLFFPTKSEVDAWGTRFGWIYILPAVNASATTN